MSTVDQKELSPVVVKVVWGKKSEFYLTTEVGEVSLDFRTYETVQHLGKSSPNFVPASRLIEAHLLRMPEQVLAERMHWLSQPEVLGRHLEWQTFAGRHVAYRIIPGVEFLDVRQEPQLVEPKRPKELGRVRRLIGWLLPGRPNSPLAS